MAGLNVRLNKTSDLCVSVLLLGQGSSRPGAVQCVGGLGDV